MPGIPPPMPPMPPISGIAGADDLSSGLSVIIASVVVSKAATETASISAVLTTLVGSTIQLLPSHKIYLTGRQIHRSYLYSLGFASKHRTIMTRFCAICFKAVTLFNNINISLVVILNF